jgi:hypothetical protein
MRSEWRREQEHLKTSRALRAATRHCRAKCRASLSRLKQDLTDMGGQLTEARIAVAQSYAMLAVLEKILAGSIAPSPQFRVVAVEIEEVEAKETVKS